MATEARIVERRTVESCWPYLLEMLQAMDAVSEAEAAAIWDDVEAWATRRGYETPKQWAARYDATMADLEDMPTEAMIDRAIAVARTGSRPSLGEPLGLDEGRGAR